MATNKNQHFVPRCYLRPFTIDSANLAINLFNIDRLKFIECASVKHQCSGDYFYGEDLGLEKALQFTEGSYAAALREILKPNYNLTDSHRKLLRRFWLLQHMRTEAASRRAIEMTEAMGDVIGGEASSFRLGIREAVQDAMRAFVERMDMVDDLKICLLRNRTAIPFITSDDPAVLTNRWYLVDRRTRGASFGLQSAGNLLLLPLSPKVLCIGYDGDVYSVPHKGGWADVRHDKDIQALNQHQLLNCRANIFIHDQVHARGVHDAYSRIAPLRPSARHKINYAVLDRHEGDITRYRVVDRTLAGEHQEALIHTQAVHAIPSAWPRQILWRPKGIVFTNGTGIGYMRRALVELGIYEGFQKELVSQTK
ncbi:MAG: DUF4238 domain-containing protein [Gallionella sp.]